MKADDEAVIKRSDVKLKSWNMTINCSVELGAAGKRPARADSPHLDPKGMLYVLLQP